MEKKDLRLERKRHRWEENKLSILESAERIFSQKGYSLATMDDIAEESQFSKATIYRYFRSKAEIFFEIVFAAFEEMHQRIKKISGDKISAEEKLWRIIYQTTSFYRKKRNLTRILFMEKSLMRKVFNIDPKKYTFHLNEHPKVPDEFRVKIKKISEITCEIIQEGIEKGEFRNVDLNETVSVFGAMLRGFSFRGPMREREYSVKKTTDLLHGFFLNGIKKC
jgi:AcrR family transcriptional regulator